MRYCNLVTRILVELTKEDIESFLSENPNLNLDIDGIGIFFDLAGQVWSIDTKTKTEISNLDLLSEWAWEKYLPFHNS